MIIVKIIGGLGNQMFQYAYARVLKEKGFNVKIDISAFDTYKLHGGYQLDKYNIDLNIATKEEKDAIYKENIYTKVLRKFGIENINRIKEKSLLFNNEHLNIDDNKYIDGYFQSELYFENIRDMLMQQLTIDTKSLYTQFMETEIINSVISCSLHIRRGDFTNSTNIGIHGTCDINYYKKSMELINTKFDNVKYFIFSDDIKWVKENLQIKNAVYIDSKEKRIPHEDIYLMSICNHNIIANSSFSWWSAWLNQNNKKVIVAPKRWFSDEKMFQQSFDIVPVEWIKL